MGGGSWTEKKFIDYASSKGRRYDTSTKKTSTQNMFAQKRIHPSLNPFNVIRECCDSQEHPNTIPVILALDVTGSMGNACIETASALSQIMDNLYKKYTDIEFMMMAIGDLAYDDAPIQASQFESDERIAEAIDNIFMEMGGGGNAYESYTAAWYFGLHHTKLDCWKRGKKGIIITLGDEPMNPYLPAYKLRDVLGDNLQGDVNTGDLYSEVIKKFEVFHIAIDDYSSSYRGYADAIHSSWGSLLSNHLKVSTINQLSNTIVECIDDSINIDSDMHSMFDDLISKETSQEIAQAPESGVITW